MADLLHRDRVLLAKWMRRLTGWKGRQVSRQVWDQQVAPLVREKLAGQLIFMPFKVKTYLDSSDGFTRKTLFKLPDGNLIEAVLMRYGDPADNPQITASAPNSENLRGAKNRRTLCIFTQAGCAMGCVFCATGQMGFKRHLSSGEIVAQVLYYARMLRKADWQSAPQGTLSAPQQVTNIVLMGMGEPFHNYDITMAAIDRLNDPDGFNFGAIVWRGGFGYDDSLDVVGIHGAGGDLGTLATGLFASKAINAAGADGLFFGNAAQFGVQLLTAVVVAVFSAAGTFVLLKLVGGMTVLRVAPEEEATGLDLSQHMTNAPIRKRSKQRSAMSRQRRGTGRFRIADC